eukprot:UN02122
MTLELIPLLVDVLKVYKSDESIAETTLRILTCITLSEDLQNKTKAFESGLLTELDELFQTSKHNKSMLFSLCCLLRNLTQPSKNSSNRDYIYKNKTIVPHLIRVTGAHMDEEMICWMSTSVLLNLTVPPP